MSNPPRYKYEGFERAALKLLVILINRASRNGTYYSGEEKYLAKIAYELDTPLNTRL